MKIKQVASSLIHGPSAMRPVTWVPSTYLAKGLLVVIITCVTLVMGKRMGLTNTETAFFSSCLYLPFLLKPCFRMLFTSPLVRRWCVVAAEACTALALYHAGTCLTMRHGTTPALIALALVALCGGVHNSAVDDVFYYQLRRAQRAAWVNVGLLFYNLATVVGMGVLIMLAGNMEVLTRNLGEAWNRVFFIGSMIYMVLAVVHLFALPSFEPAAVRSSLRWDELQGAARSLWQKPGKWAALAFILFYPAHESFLYRGSMLFMVDKGSCGGLSMGPQEVAFSLGTVGAFAFMLGGLVGKKMVTRGGLKAWLWPMALAFTLSDLVYVYLSYAMPANVIRISVLAGIEQFFSGFGLSAYLLFIIYFSQGADKKLHYDLCLSCLLLGVMVCGMLMGWMQDMLGYRHYFVVVACLSVLTYGVCAFVRIPPDYGKHQDGTSTAHYPDGF